MNDDEKSRRLKRQTAPQPAVLSAFAAVLVIPFYVGLVHWKAWQFFLYATVASIALPAGEHFGTTPRLRGGLAAGLMGAVVWFLAIALACGVTFLIALLS